MSNPHIFYQSDSGSVLITYLNNLQYCHHVYCVIMFTLLRTHAAKTRRWFNVELMMGRRRITISLPISFGINNKIIYFLKMFMFLWHVWDQLQLIRIHCSRLPKLTLDSAFYKFQHSSYFTDLDLRLSLHNVTCQPTLAQYLENAVTCRN